MQFTVSKETHDKLRRVQNLLCREIPSGDPAAIFERALDLLLQDVEKKKLAAAAKPRPPRATGMARVTSRPTWCAPSGSGTAGSARSCGRSGRCTERRFLEWHHVQPFGHQGPATVENISLRCRAHNVYESELVFGRFDPSVVRESARRTTLFPGKSRRSGTADARASADKPRRHGDTEQGRDAQRNGNGTDEHGTAWQAQDGRGVVARVRRGDRVAQR